MVRSDDDDGNGNGRTNADSAAMVSGAAEGVMGIFALGAIIGASGSEYFRDLRATIELLFGGGGLEAALREERARNKATVLALAVIADGVASLAARLRELDADERLELFVAVKNLAHRGSRAWPEQRGYRGAAGSTPEALIAIFRDALGITAAGRV